MERRDQMTPKRYKLLRRTMFEDDVDQATLAKAIGRSCGYMTDRFTGKHPFKADDMYKILDYFSIPYDQMHLFFPPDGILPVNK